MGRYKQRRSTSPLENKNKFMYGTFSLLTGAFFSMSKAFFLLLEVIFSIGGGGGGGVGELFSFYVKIYLEFLRSSMLSLPEYSS